MDYEVYITKEKEWFIADVPALPGCMSQGKTEKEAIENIKDAINGYLHVVKKHKIKLPEHKELAEGLLKTQIKRSGITHEEFKKLGNNQ